MKNYLKLVIVVAGITLATVGNIQKSTAKAIPGRCTGGGCCGTSYGGQEIDGTWTHA